MANIGDVVKGSDGRSYMYDGTKFVPVVDAPAVTNKGRKAKVASASQTFVPVEGVWKGKPTLQLSDFPYPFTFGVRNAKMILANVDSIRAFVKAHPDPIA